VVNVKVSTGLDLECVTRSGNEPQGL